MPAVFERLLRQGAAIDGPLRYARAMRIWLVLAVVAGCQQHGGGERESAAARSSDVTAWVGDAQRAAIGDLTGDGRAEIALADARRLRIVDASGRELASTAAPAGIQVLGIARGLVLAGWGETREHRGAAARVSIYRLDGGKLVEARSFEPQTSRSEIVALVPAPDGTLLVAYYESKYLVRVARMALADAATKLDDVATLRMAAGFAYAAGELVVARVYGDELHSEGDAFVLHADGTRTAIPTTRGARAIVAGEGEEVFLADGWNENYAQVARGLVTRDWRDNAGAWHSELVEDLASEYSAGKLVAADLDGDGHVELISSGNKYVRVFRRSGAGWTGETIDPNAARDIAVGSLDGELGASILIVGDKSELVRPR
jgi:hypothetical protein